MRALPVIAIVALGASGCVLVNDPSQHVGGTEPIPPSELCSRLVTLQCEQYVRCCGTAPPDFDIDACISGYLRACEESVGPYLAYSRTGYDPILAAEAIAEGEALSSTCSLEITHWATARGGLFRAFRGTVPVGDDCTPRDAMDVASLMTCRGVENACVPMVAERFVCVRRVGRGEFCFLNGDCEDGLACMRTMPLDPTSGRCTDRLSAGAVCRQATDCESYYCDIPTGVMVGTCVAATQDNLYCGVAD